MRCTPIVLCLLLLLSLFPTFYVENTGADDPPAGQTIIGDSVVWENNWARLEVYPHTSNNIIRQTQYANLTWKLPDNTIDIAFRFDQPLSYGRAWLWRNISHDVMIPDYGWKTLNYTLIDITTFQLIQEPSSVDLGDIPSDFYAQGTASYYNPDIAEWDNRTFTIGFDTFQWQNPEHTRCYFEFETWAYLGSHIEQRYWPDWWDATSQFSHITYNNKEYYYVSTLPVTQSTTYKLKWQYDQPVHSSGKWELLAKLSEDTIQYALSNNRYVMIDPWWNSSYPYMKGTGITNNETDYAVRIQVYNLTDGGGDLNLSSHLGYWDFRDVVFLGDDNATQLWFWLQNYTENVSATFYVNISTFDYINVYYGVSTGLTGYDTYMNGTNTFDRFDDFEGYAINDVPATNGWTVTAAAPSYIKVVANPDGDGQVLDIHQAGGNPYIINTMPSKYDDVRMNFRIYYTDLSNDNYAPYIYEDASVRFSASTAEADSTDDLNWYTGGAYVDFVPDLKIYIDNWYRWLSYLTTSGADDWDIMNNDSTMHDGGSRSATVVGLNIFRFNFAAHAVSYYIDEFWVDDYVLTEPSWTAFGAEQSAPSNAAPQTSNPCIWDALSATNSTFNTTCIAISPTSFNITINDPEGDKMNITLMTNESGSWTVVNQTSGSGLANGTYNFTNVSWVDSWATTYWLSYNVTDNTSWNNCTYYFTTRDAATITLMYPANGSVGIPLQPTVWFWVETVCVYDLDVYISENSTGAWVQRQTNLSITPDYSINWTFTEASSYLTTYWFRINITQEDDGDPNASYWFSFTTQPPASDPVITLNLPTNGSTTVCPYTSGLSVTITQDEGYRMNLTFESNESGAWETQKGGRFIYITNGTYAIDMINCTRFNNTYWWRVNVSVYTNTSIYNVSWYTFTTTTNIECGGGTGGSSSGYLITSHLDPTSLSVACFAIIFAMMSFISRKRRRP